TVDCMPVALKSQALPLPPAMGVAPGNTPVATGTNATGSFDFLALLANMNTLAASVLPANTTADASADPLLATDAGEIAEPEAKAKEKDADDDTATADDDELLAALQLTGVPIPVPPQSTTQTKPAAVDAVSDAIVDALTGGQGNPSQS